MFCSPIFLIFCIVLLLSFYIQLASWSTHFQQVKQLQIKSSSRLIDRAKTVIQLEKLNKVPIRVRLVFVMENDFQFQFSSFVGSQKCILYNKETFSLLYFQQFQFRKGEIRIVSIRPHSQVQIKILQRLAEPGNLRNLGNLFPQTPLFLNGQWFCLAFL